MRKLVLVAALAIATTPALADAHRGGGHNHGDRASQRGEANRQQGQQNRNATARRQAAKACTAEQQQSRAAFRRCVREHLAAARKRCREERAADRAAFREKYGTGKRNVNAFRNCVRRWADGSDS